MSRVPPALQSLWPVIKRGHRYGARVAGAVGRRTGGPRRGLPHTASPTSRATAQAEPGSAVYHPLGAAFDPQRPLPSGSPPHPYFERHRGVPVPERYVLELTDGRVVGRHCAVVTAGGRLDMETSQYFGITGWKEHPVFLNPWPRPPEEVDGTVAVLSARGTGANYYHFLMDALPRIGMIEQAFPGLVPDAWVVDQKTRYHRELLDLMGFEGRRLIEPAPGFAVRAKRLLVPGLPNASTLVSPETTRWLRDRLPPKRLEGRPELLYVTRGTTPRTRRVVQEEELFARLARRGFVRIDPGTLPIQEQIDHFAAARVVVGPHGAALVNLAFARPGVRVLELFAPGYVNGGYWAITSGIPDSHYRYLIAPNVEGHPPDANVLMEDIDLDPAHVERALDLLMEAS